jgi:hydroxymethylpyrimidine pyrophosphatase-like HAD family hydrolase
VELIVFDLDGTLLNQESAISDYTSETLKLLAQALQLQKFSYTNEHKTPMSIQKDMIKT